eukprot:9076063-Ditylum_brightwellii.AAC.1
MLGYYARQSSVKRLISKASITGKYASYFPSSSLSSLSSSSSSSSSSPSPTIKSPNTPPPQELPTKAN